MDELYVIARRVLLDALEALGEHREATILVGAQAVYLHTGISDGFDRLTRPLLLIHGNGFHILVG